MNLSLQPKCFCILVELRLQNKVKEKKCLHLLKQKTINGIVIYNKIEIIEHDILNAQFCNRILPKNFANLQYLGNFYFVIQYCF